jgi:hypothetical protein
MPSYTPGCLETVDHLHRPLKRPTPIGTTRLSMTPSKSFRAAYFIRCFRTVSHRYDYGASGISVFRWIMRVVERRANVGQQLMRENRAGPSGRIFTR